MLVMPSDEELVTEEEIGMAKQSIERRKKQQKTMLSPRPSRSQSITCNINHSVAFMKSFPGGGGGEGRVAVNS